MTEKKLVLAPGDDAALVAASRMAAALLIAHCRDTEVFEKSVIANYGDECFDAMVAELRRRQAEWEREEAMNAKVLKPAEDDQC